MATRDIVDKTTTTATTDLLDARLITSIDGVIPKKRGDVLNWYGWGYRDTRFYIDERGRFQFQGKRYPLDGCTLPLLQQWVLERFNLVAKDNGAVPEMPRRFPEPRVEDAFVAALEAAAISSSVGGEDRFSRCHGQTLEDIYSVRHNMFERIPDIVAWPRSHEDVERIIASAHEHNVVLIPFGGGTSVSGSITCPQREPRSICVLDMTQMNRMLWLNRDNLTVCFEAGVVGQDMERALRPLGLTVGHEPDSFEFSTLGGWVATRASGMKKNVYGNIEDLLVRVKMATVRGVLERNSSAPRISCGPDFNHIVLGSEGTLGVVTEVVLKVRPLPAVQYHGSLVFPDFELGVEFMREVARRRCQPASVRLMDNEQFVIGQCLKPEKSATRRLVDGMQKVYVTHIKRLDMRRICVATLLFEGERDAVRRQQALIFDIARRYKGFSAGSDNGKNGYVLTFVIAYIRDFALNHDIVGESFETSVPWDRCSSLCRNVKARVEEECHRLGIRYFVVSCRVTQTYDAGACVYFYFGFRFTGHPDPVHTFELVENAARDEILTSGGSVSHHHGIGKIRARWYQGTVTATGSALYRAMKHELDPKNIFAVGNLLPNEASHPRSTTSPSASSPPPPPPPAAKSKL